MRRFVAPLVASLALSAVVVGAPVVAPSTAAAAEVVVTLDGAGNGHGFGLSQWGAYGYAVDHGWSAAQILDHYYNGTVAGSVPLDTTITVRLQNLDDAQTAVVSESGGLVVDGLAGGPWKSVLAREVSPSVYSVWARADAQVCPSSSGNPASTGWTLIAGSVATKVDIRTQADTTTAAFPSLPAVCEPGGKVRSYRGFIRAVNGTAGENRTVNVAPLEHYLRSVIAKEMSPSWSTAGGGKGAQALQAQAVAARSYALAENKYSYAKTCDMICQYYLGAASRNSVGSSYVQIEYPSTDAAVLATAGVVRRVGNSAGPIAYTMFSASSGGHTADGVGALMPWTAVVDEGDDTSLNPNYRWTTTLTGSAITAKYPEIGTFQSLTVLTRNGYGEWGGRVTSIRITGSNASVTRTGDQFKSAFGLKANWFTVRGSGPFDPCDGRNAPAVGAAPGTAAAARYTPLAPVRLIDTRDGTGTTALPLAAGCTLVVDPGVAPTVTAVAVNLTSVLPATGGYVTAYPCGVARPEVSAIQAIGGRTVAGMAVVPLGADGTFCVFSSIRTALVVDLFGTYEPGAGDRFEPVSPVRLRDTRPSGVRVAAGAVFRVPVSGVAGVPAGATGAALTVHSTGATGSGWATVYPCSATVPLVSSLNVVSGSSVTNHVEVALNGAGEVCVEVSTAMHITVDLSGWYGASATTEFYALPPFRALDTRSGIGLSGTFSPNVSRALPLAGQQGLPAATTLRSVVAEVTAVYPSGSGFLTVHPCLATAPEVSMVRYASIGNAATTVVGTDDATGRWCILASSSIHVLVDISGYFA
jgi:SpoIID/LytB domain protein